LDVVSDADLSAIKPATDMNKPLSMNHAMTGAGAPDGASAADESARIVRLGLNSR
jgi:hypothetical protein